MPVSGKQRDNRLALAIVAVTCRGNLSTAGGWRRSMSDQIASTIAWAEANAMVVRSRGATTRFSQA
jgi:hypothetical protein